MTEQELREARRAIRLKLLRIQDRLATITTTIEDLQEERTMLQAKRTRLQAKRDAIVAQIGEEV